MFPFAPLPLPYFIIIITYYYSEKSPIMLKFEINIYQRPETGGKFQYPGIYMIFDARVLVTSEHELYSIVLVTAAKEF